MEMWSVENYESEEVAKTKWQEFAKLNEIKKFDIKKE